MALATAQELRKLYWEEGHDLVSLGKRYQRSPGTVWGWFRELGVPTRSVKEAAKGKARAVTEDEVARMVSLYQSGMSSNDVGRELGRAGRLVRGYLEKRGVLRPRKVALRRPGVREKVRRHTLNESFFSEWSPGMAWVLGLLFGDRLELLGGHSRELGRWLYEDTSPAIRCAVKYSKVLGAG